MLDEGVDEVLEEGVEKVVRGEREGVVLERWKGIRAIVGFVGWL